MPITSSIAAKKYGTVSLSGGIVIAESNSKDVLNDVVVKADEALYKAKSKGRDGYVIFQPVLDKIDGCILLKNS